jgi:hypothetical protein
VTGQESADKRTWDAETFRKSWYDGQYAALQEPPFGQLSAPATNREIYRFTWLRTFHHPIAIRVEIGNQRAQVFVKETDGAGGYNPGKLIQNLSFELTESELASFKSAIDESRFWLAPARDKVLGSDGAQWLFDACKNESCHVVDRWSPDEKKPFRNLGEFFLRLGKVKIPKDEIY